MTQYVTGRFVNGILTEIQLVRSNMEEMRFRHDMLIFLLRNVMSMFGCKEISEYYRILQDSSW